jgi:hypothetical protein
MRTDGLTQIGALLVEKSQALQLIQREAHARSHGRVKDLSVEACEKTGAVILKGRSQTYHAKQLAQHGVLDLLTRQDIRLALNIGDAPKLVNDVEVA